jgi:RNA polymerase sigma factor (sigma-70 family)
VPAPTRQHFVNGSSPNLLAMPRRTSFADAYDEHVWQVYGFFAYRVGGREEAEDLTQATWERALRAWPRYDPERAQPLTWLLAIARNLLIDYRRGERRTEPLEDDGLALGSTSGEQPGGLDPRLEIALETLSPREREVIGLRYGADLKGPEIAKVTGTSLASVQQALSRALRRLREEMGEHAESSS